MSYIVGLRGMRFSGISEGYLSKRRGWVQKFWAFQFIRGLVFRVQGFRIHARI